MKALPPSHILVVEDDPDVRELLSELLSQEGYATVAAPDVEQALQYIALEKPDLVITDLMMPGRAGTGLLRHLASDPRHDAIPTILLTAVGPGVAEKAVAEAGVRTELVRKPIRIDELLGLIRNLLINASAGRGSGPRQAPE